MIACIDLGLKRIGVALCLNDVVVPINPIIRINRSQAAKELSQICKDYKISKLVIGLPEASSSFEEMKARAQHFASLLDFSGEIVYFDESFSSKNAAKFVKSCKNNHKTGQQDSAAAMLVLREYLGL